MPIITSSPRRRRRPLLRSAMVLGLALLPLTTLTACGDDTDDAGSSGEGGAKTAVTIGYQDFGESDVAAHIYGEVLAADDFTVEYQPFKDRAAIYAAFESGDIDLAVEYAASGVEFLNKNAGEASSDVDATVSALEAQLAKLDLAAGKVSEAVDTNALVVAGDADYDKISDLSADLKLGGPQDCPSNAGCIPALKDKYDLDFSASFVPLDASGPLTKEALEQGDIDVAVLFSTDPSIADKGFKVLEDDKGIFNADNILPVGTKSFVTDNKAILDKVSAAFTTENVTEFAKRFVIDKEDSDTIAKDFVKDNNL